MIQRIKALATFEGLTIADFALKIGISPNTLSNYVQERRKLSLQVVEAILAAFPEVSAEWLIRGKGAMIISDQEPQKQPEVQNGDGIVVKNVGKATNIGGGGVNEILEAFYKHNSEQTKAMRQEIENLHQIINNLINKMQR